MLVRAVGICLFVSADCLAGVLACRMGNARISWKSCEMPGEGALMQSCCTLSCELKLGQIHRQVVGKPSVSSPEGLGLCASRMIPNPSLKGSRATILVVPDLEPLPAAREVGDCSTLILGGFVVRISFHVLDILYLIPVLVVPQTSDVGFLVEQVAQPVQLVGVPSHGLCYCFVP